MTFPHTLPAAPWEASAMLANTALAAGVPNVARLDRLTNLEGIVANLMLGAPPTLGARALPATKVGSGSPITRPDGIADASDLTGAQFVTFLYYGEDDDDRPVVLTTRPAVDLIDAIPFCQIGDAWLVLIGNAAKTPLTVQGARGVVPDGPLATLAPRMGQLFAVVVTGRTTVRFTPILMGQTQ